VSRTSAGAELSDALQAVGSATKGKAADTAKKVKTKTAKASDSISSAFDTAARRSWRTRRKTDRRSRVYARKRRKQLARAERAKLRATAAAASVAEAAAKLVSGDEDVPKKKRTSAKTFAFTLLAAGATLAVIQQLLGRRHADTTSTNGSGADPGQSASEQATATATEASSMRCGVRAWKVVELMALLCTTVMAQGLFPRPAPGAAASMGARRNPCA